MGTVIQVNWADVLRTEGINAKGYGLLPKYPMFDTDLTLTAKTIYAYLCSLSGNGESTYPSVETIKSHLGFGRKAYESNFKQLLDTGYVIRQKQRGEHSRFDHNLYILASNPKKFEHLRETAGEGNNQIISRICVSGLKSVGYGMIPRAVMCDSRLSYKAKGLYAYFAAFTGAGNVAFPSLEQITRQLGINKDTYYKYMKELTSLNYITVVQRHNGKFAGNQYYLNDKPDEAAVQKKHIVQDTEEQFPKKGTPVNEQLPKKGTSAENQFPKKEHPVEEPPEKELPENLTPEKQPPANQTAENQHTEKETPKKAPANNNTVPINTFSNNTSVYQQINLSTTDLKEIRWIDSLEREELKETLYEYFDLIEDNYIPFGVPLPAYFSRKKAIVDIMADIIQDKRPVYVISKLRVNREELIHRFLQLDEYDLESLLNRMDDAPAPIKNVKAYALVSLYNAALTKDLTYNAI